ncbi:MAG: AMP-dependent synthetase/ligase [Streptosporangiaceae bacterium]
MGENACDDVFGWAAREAGRVLFCVKDGGAWRPVTAEQFAARVTSVAAGLIAGGIGPGDRIGLMAAPSLDWLVCDFAIWAAGAVTVPVYETSSVEQIGWELSDSGTVAVFAGNAEFAGAIGRAQPAKVETVWQLDAGGLDALARAGQGVAAEELARRRGAVTSATLATIVYTSGTTGRPKGCMITHGNLTETVHAVISVPGVRDRVLTGDASSLFFLPLSHILARVVALCLLHAGKRAAYLADPGDLPAELPAFQPTILLVVPRVLEKIVTAARQRAEAEGHQRLFAAAEATAIAYSRAGRRPGIRLRLRHAAYGRLVYVRLRRALGGRLAWVVSGGAPLTEDLGHFLRGAGMTVLEGWGLTETTGPATINPPRFQRIGSVGRPLPGCAARIAADGEVELQGPLVFQGYWQDPQATSEAFDGRWLRTGDLGRVDDDGFVYITGRKKELIITAGGKNLVPSVLEDRARENWMIAECVVIGDRRPYIAALVTLDGEAFARWKQRQGKPAGATVGELSEDPDLRAVVQTAVDRANTAVSRAESIKRFRILPSRFEIGAELTPTQKVRRDYVLTRYAADTEALYT